jgi:hypothetical protein
MFLNKSTESKDSLHFNSRHNPAQVSVTEEFNIQSVGKYFSLPFYMFNMYHNSMVQELV